jgi:hypothetical protein
MKSVRHAVSVALMALAVGCGDTSPRWTPRPGTSWQIQYTGPLELELDVMAYNLDLFNVPAETFARLRARGRKVICYFSAGSHEDWRPDAGRFPTSVLGRELVGWPGERWLDVRSPAVRELMRARLDLARQKGCDAVDPDNVDGHINATGFPLTAREQLDFNRFLATEAHARGLAIGLKNDVSQIVELEPFFDFAVNEECFQYGECERNLPFIQAGKAVFQIEYGSASLSTQVCPRANQLNLDTLIKNLSLDASRIACR